MGNLRHGSGVAMSSKIDLTNLPLLSFDNVVFVNNAVIGGHVEISDYVYLGGQSAVHQFCRIGKHAIIGAGTTIDGDVIPFTSVVGSRGYLSGLNLVGLKRRSFKKGFFFYDIEKYFERSNKFKLIGT